MIEQQVRELADRLAGMLAGDRGCAIIGVDLRCPLESGVAEGFDADRYGWLAEAERRQYQTFSLPKRRREWLGGRFAVKSAALRLLPDAAASASVLGPVLMGQMTVMADVHGKPYLLSDQHDHDPLPAISISHSRNLAMGMAYRGASCGIDIQEDRAAVVRVRERFAVRAEERILADLAMTDSWSEQAWMTLLWAAKEALRKAVPCRPMLGFLETRLWRATRSAAADVLMDFHCPRLAGRDAGPDRPVLRVAAGFLPGYGVAATCFSLEKNEEERCR